MMDSNTQALADKIEVALNTQIPFDGTCSVRAVSERTVAIRVDSLRADYEEVKRWVGESDRANMVDETTENGVFTMTVEKEEKSVEKLLKEVGN